MTPTQKQIPSDLLVVLNRTTLGKLWADLYMRKRVQRAY